MTATTPIALTVAGSDSSGGAGIQADLKTFSALGVYGASVIAALTAQNTRGVTAIHEVPPGFVAAQIDAVFSDLTVAAVKIGMLGNADIIAAVAAGLARHEAANVVLDPVMVATSGDRLLKPDAVEVLRTQLMPRAVVITPNLPEAAALLDAPVATSSSGTPRRRLRRPASPPATPTAPVARYRPPSRRGSPRGRGSERRCATRRRTSRLRLQRPTGWQSGLGKGRCITFTGGGDPVARTQCRLAARLPPRPRSSRRCRRWPAEIDRRPVRQERPLRCRFRRPRLSPRRT
jgi:Phosphomethylpyrimidine kinase